MHGFDSALDGSQKGVRVFSTGVTPAQGLNGSVTTPLSPHTFSRTGRGPPTTTVSLPTILSSSTARISSKILSPKGRHPPLLTKTIYGVFNTPVNAVWGTVAPQICEFLKARKIRYSAITTARFVTHGEDGKDTLGPVVLWIATHPTTTSAENAHDASPDILALLKANGVEGVVVVEWYVGAIERLSGPHLLHVTDDTNPTHYVRRFLTAALGMPITTAEREAADAQRHTVLPREQGQARRP